MITTYMKNSGGLNLTDSPLFMKDDQATGISYNYDYSVTGSISKVLSSALLNPSPDTQLKTLGLGMYHDADTDGRTLIRAAGTKFQTVDTTTGVITNLTDDTNAANGDFLNSSSTSPVVFSPFNTVSGGTALWASGGGLANLVGYYGSKVTSNGVNIPAGSLNPTVNSHAGGSWASIGNYYYAVQFRKASTQAFSNLALDVLATIVHTDDTVTIPLTSITGIDTTLYDQIIIWRSVVNGASLFTTGSIIAQLAITATTFTDTGNSVIDSQNSPRPGYVILDNSILPSGTFTCVTAFKRRLATCLGSTLYVSDLNKPESWPLENAIVIPSGGPITALGVIGVPSEYTTGADEYLCIWKERELWVLTGSSADDWELLFVDKTGCAGQSLVVNFNGFCAWMGYTGIFMWEGKGRPSRVSLPIQGLWNSDGDLAIGLMNQGYAAYFEKRNEAVWRVSSNIKGTNQLSIKLDTRLTGGYVWDSKIQNPELPGVFISDTDVNSYYSICSFKSSNHDEQMIAGDGSGNIYRLYGAAGAVSFDYETKPFDMGHPEVLKRFKRVLVYIEKLTVNDLTMFFWADYRIRSTVSSKVAQTMSPQQGSVPAIFDVGLFDYNLWDDYVVDISPIEFNIHNQENNAEGISLKLRFEQLEASAPVRIHGFAIEWEPASNLPLPTAQVG